ncbi:dTMP kinase [Serpentinicella alkaliphila]|uniref:Thymidylate kinase n=1 Tax=Serpentinicella alkaliphila TaxID=1734049 RepID=A0A4R2TEK0_9FIRM|nr:dTMP kinase [Serpentinicella alkaliphila]QUH25112.1 dTMP kinase [Serpentinicella alkaliphila]TCQ01758.1 thymidylate kinase [Serpentinicella alkaliphila]
MKGLFITIEGLDGAGKTTQIAFIKEYLINRGYNVIVTREPGGTRIGEKIRNIILDRENEEMCGMTEALLYAASRAQHVSEVIIPAIERGNVVLCDRFVDSSIVYQGAGRGLGYNIIKTINDFATNYLEPNLTIFFDIPPEITVERIKASRQSDRLEQEEIHFHKKVYEEYKELAKKFPNRIKIVKADNTVENIKNDIEVIIKELLEA